MRIKEISCEQFAGLRGREFEFDNGLNLLIGENESGKSTLVDLIYQLLFYHTSIKENNNADKEFKERYYPKWTGDAQSEYLEGSVRLETEDGRYRLRKRWGKNHEARLTLPDGRIMDNETEIEGVLADKLKYGKGVYDELVFTSQRRPQTLLQGLLGDGKGNVRELSAVISKAVMETGGIAIEKVENELCKTINDYEGCWDFTAGRPKLDKGKKREIDNPWIRDAGKIVKAYYAKETVLAAQNAAEQAEKRIEEVNHQIRICKETRDRENDRRDSFSQIRGLLVSRQANKQLLEDARNALKVMTSAAQNWPLKAEALRKAEALKKELEQAQTKALYDRVDKIVSEKEALQKEADRIGSIPADAVRTANSLEKAINRLESKLQGMNLSARIRQLGAEPIEICSSVSGQSLDITGEAVDITEAVDIRVPGVVEIQISPKGIDVEAVKKDSGEKRDRLADLFHRYDVASVDELSGKQQRSNSLAGKLEVKEAELKTVLGGKKWEDLKTEGEAIPDGGRTPEEVDSEIKRLCGFQTVDIFIGSVTAEIRQYERDYGDMDRLASLTVEKAGDIKTYEKKVKAAESIPEEFDGIDDPDQYDEELKNRINEANQDIEDLRKDLSKAEKALGEKSAEEYAEECHQAKAAFEECKAEHARWKHIQEVFLNVKNAAKGNPMADIEQYFRENLSTLSAGSLVLESLGDDLGSTITSGTNRLNASILSDGTKDTIALAFRLAVLKHLFPDGGCVAVFDDPFTDMDPKRTAQACKLLEDFAKNNQVIFVSCDDKYTKFMDGNIIRIAR